MWTRACSHKHLESFAESRTFPQWLPSGENGMLSPRGCSSYSHIARLTQSGVPERASPRTGRESASCCSTSGTVEIAEMLASTLTVGKRWRQTNPFIYIVIFIIFCCFAIWLKEHILGRLQPCWDLSQSCSLCAISLPFVKKCRGGSDVGLKAILPRW